MDRNHFQSMLEKSGRISYALESWHGRLSNKMQPLAQTLNSLIFSMKHKSTRSTSLSKLVPEEKPDTITGRKALTQNEKETGILKKRGCWLRNLPGRSSYLDAVSEIANCVQSLLYL